MKGKVKNVKRNVFNIENATYTHSHDVHSERRTNMWVKLYNNDEVEIDESDILRHYKRVKFSDKLIDTLRNELHNKYIEYDFSNDGTFILHGSMSNYIK